MEMVYNQNGIDVYYYNYKEPFRKFKGGYGFMGALAYSKDKEKIQCHFCGEFFSAIRVSHINSCEGVKKYEKKNNTLIETMEDYKKAVGLNLSAVMVGEATRERLVKNAMTPSMKAKRAKLLSKEEMEKRKKELIENNKKRRGNKMSLEYKNKKGTCPDQLLDRILHCKKEIGHVPSKREFYKFYKGKYLGAIYATYGSYIKAVELTGNTPRAKTYKGNFKYTDKELLGYLQRFVEINKRLSTYSDHERGLLPGYDTYIKRFGSINLARKQAGLPSMYRVGPFRIIYDYADCDEKYLKYFKDEN